MCYLLIYRILYFAQSLKEVYLAKALCVLIPNTRLVALGIKLAVLCILV